MFVGEVASTALPDVGKGGATNGLHWEMCLFHFRASTRRVNSSYMGPPVTESGSMKLVLTTGNSF